MLFRSPKGYDALERLGIRAPEERDIQWMVLKGMRVPPAAVLQVKQRANSTRSEMIHLARLLDENRIWSVILVTSKSHSTRARKILARISGGRIAIISRPSRYDTFDPTGWWRSREDAKDVLLEYEKLLHYWVQSAGSDLTGWLRGRAPFTAPAEATS